MRRKADAKVAGSSLDPMGTSSNEDEEHALPSALRANDIVGIRLASSGTRTKLTRHGLLRDTS
jgi:hypothetical protein